MPAATVSGDSRLSPALATGAETAGLRVIAAACVMVVPSSRGLEEEEASKWTRKDSWTGVDPPISPRGPAA